MISVCRLALESTGTAAEFHHCVFWGRPTRRFGKVHIFLRISGATDDSLKLNLVVAVVVVLVVVVVVVVVADRAEGDTRPVLHHLRGVFRGPYACPLEVKNFY